MDLKILRRDIAWGPHADLRPYQFWSSYSRGRALLSDIGTMDLGTFRRGTATKMWFIPVGNGGTNGEAKSVELRELGTDTLILALPASTVLGVDTQDANRYYGMDITSAGANQEIYLRFVDNAADGWFGVAINSFFLEI